MVFDQQMDESKLRRKRATAIMAMIVGALVCVSIYNMLDGRTTAGLAGLAVAVAVTPVALRARATS